MAALDLKSGMCRALAQPIVVSQAYTVSAEILNEAGWQGVNQDCFSMPLMRTTSNLSISGTIARVLRVTLPDACVKDTFIHVRFPFSTVSARIR